MIVKRFLKQKWVLPVAALVLTLSIGSAAFAATGSPSTDTSAVVNSTAVTATAGSAVTTASDASSGTSTAQAPDSSKPWGNQRSDETVLTGDALAKVQAAAVAKEAGTGATVVRVETDADGNAKYEVHMVKADGTPFTVYVDESYSVVSVQDGCQGGGHHGGRDNDADDSGSGTGSTSTDVTSITG
jgi:uncharacterized membrane protein YkoI